MPILPLVEDPKLVRDGLLKGRTTITEALGLSESFNTQHSHILWQAGQKPKQPRHSTYLDEFFSNGAPAEPNKLFSFDMTTRDVTLALLAVADEPSAARRAVLIEGVTALYMEILYLDAKLKDHEKKRR